MKKDQHEKIISAQTIAHDLIAEVSAMINQEGNLTIDSAEKLKERIEELSEMLDSIETRNVDF